MFNFLNKLFCFKKNNNSNEYSNNMNKINNVKEKNNIKESDSKTDDILQNLKIGIIEDFLNKNKVSLVSKNQIEEEEENILKGYVGSQLSDLTIYYVAGISSKKTEKVILYRYDKNSDEILTIDKKELPQNFYINSILRLVDDKYILDEKISKEIKEELEKMLENIIQNQNDELKMYRKENHFYKVEEDIESRIYLYDITAKPEFSIEEVGFPEELLEFAKEGSVFLYKDEKYTYVQDFKDIT